MTNQMTHDLGDRSLVGWIIYENLYLLFFLSYLEEFIKFYEKKGVRLSVSLKPVKHIENFSRRKMMRPTQNNSNQSAESEIAKIFISLHLFTFGVLQQIILEKFNEIQPKLHENNKYRYPKLLIPIIIYIYFHLFDHKINKSDLLAVSEISRADFNDFIMQLKKYFTREMRI